MVKKRRMGTLSRIKNLSTGLMYSPLRAFSISISMALAASGVDVLVTPSA